MEWLQRRESHILRQIYRALSELERRRCLHRGITVPPALKISQGVFQGLLIKKVAPNYPAQAKQLRLEGPVLLQATILKDGSVGNVKQLSGDAVLGHAAMDAGRGRGYAPARRARR